MKQRTTTVPQGPITTTTEWNGIAKGDDVKLEGERGHYKFVQYVEHENGNTWVAVYGGTKDPNGERGFRCVAPERIRKRKS